jgi:hypothetical protein
MLQGPHAMEQQQQQQQQNQHIGRVRVAVRFQRGQQQQEQLFWTPALSSFVKQELREMYGPGMLCDEASVVLSPTQELQPGTAYFYNVHAGVCAVAVCGPSCVKHTTESPPSPAHTANCAQQQHVLQRDAIAAVGPVRMPEDTVPGCCLHVYACCSPCVPSVYVRCNPATRIMLVY